MFDKKVTVVVSNIVTLLTLRPVSHCPLRQSQMIEDTNNQKQKNKNQSINQSILFLIKRYIINALSAVQWNTHISLNTYIYIYNEIQHTYKHSYKAAISAQIQCFYFRHTHSHTRGRCERPSPSLFLVIHL